MNTPSSRRQRILRFHQDERGDALQTVMILALAGVVVVALIYFGRGGIKEIGKFLMGIIGRGEQQQDIENLEGQ